MTSDSKKSNANEQIRRNLQRVFDEALDEQVPPDFIELIERLKAEKAEKKAKTNGH